MTNTAAGAAGTAVEVTGDAGDVAPRPLGTVARRGGRIVAAVLMLAAGYATVFTEGSLVGLQVVGALVAAVFVATSCPGDQGPAAVAAITATAALALVGPEGSPAAVVLPVTAVLALAALELIALVRLWTTAGVTNWAVERRHLAAATARVALSALAGSAVALLGRLSLPAPAVFAVAGIAAAVVVILVARPRRSATASAGRPDHS